MNEIKKIEKKPPMAERYPMTISQELYDAWQVCRRKNDSVAICKIAKLSRPIIDRALNYGSVKSERLVKQITKFFKDRYDAEHNAAEKLIYQVLNSNY